MIVKRKDRKISFHIRDYGIGIKEDRMATLFDGSTYDSTNRADSSKGMGIGLSICKTIVLAHGGTIDAINHTQGAEFFFELPAEEK